MKGHRSSKTWKQHQTKYPLKANRDDDEIDRIDIQLEGWNPMDFAGLKHEKKKNLKSMSHTQGETKIKVDTQKKE